MPRIATALWVVAAISISIGVNTYRYPVVQEMVAATPPLRLPVALSPRAQPSPASCAAADPSRSAPAGAATPSVLSASDAGPVRSPETITPAPADETVSDSRLPVDRSATTGPPESRDTRSDDVSSNAASQPGGAGSVVEPLSKYAASAQQPVVIGQVRAWPPLARPAASDGEQVTIPVQSGLPRSDKPGVSEPAGPGNGIQRLPPVDRVWPGKASDATPPSPTRIPVYPATGVP